MTNKEVAENLEAQKRVNPTGLTRRGSPCFGTEVPKHVPSHTAVTSAVESFLRSLAADLHFPVDEPVDRSGITTNHRVAAAFPKTYGHLNLVFTPLGYDRSQ